MSAIWTNFQLGIYASTRSFNLLLEQAAQMQLFWGLLMGFIVGTVMYALLLTEKPTDTIIMLWYDRATGFSKMNERKKDGGYVASFSQFTHKVRATQLAFNSAIGLVVVIAIIGFFQF